MHSIENKKIVITGAASGIGRATTIKLAQAGAAVAMLDRDVAAISQLSRELLADGHDVIPVECDLTSPDQIASAAKTVISKWKTIDILINNAGIGYHGPTHEMSHEKRNEILQVNLNAPFALFQYFLDSLLNSPCGHVVNVSSIFGLVPHQKTAAYTVSKYGLVGLSEALRAEYGRWGLGVTLVCPGFVNTPMIEDLPHREASGKQLRRPSKWLMTTPEKVADKIIGGIRKNKRLVLTTPLAHFLYHSKRLFPGLFDFVQSFKSSKIKRMLGIKPKRQPSQNGESKKAA